LNEQNPVPSEKKGRTRTAQPKRRKATKGRAQVLVQGAEKLAIINKVIGEVNVRSETDLEPPLSSPFARGHARLPFYGYDIEFFGREKELDELRAFLRPRPNQNPDFAWWLWCGRGGQGKTRLAAEICVELVNKEGWRCGFLPQTTEYKSWHNWIVSRPTFVVIDHVASRAKDIRNAICALSRSPGHVTAPLRILMLERPFDDSDAWVSELVPYESPLDCLDFFAFGYPTERSEPKLRLSSYTRMLTSLGDDDLRKIVTAATGQLPSTGTLDAGSVVEWLKEIDPERRPLFLILAVRALEENPERQLRGWNRDDLIDAVLRRDFHLWQQVLGLQRNDRMGEQRKLFDEHLMLVTAATITGRSDVGLSQKLREFGLRVPERLQPDWIRIMTGEAPKGSDSQVTPLRPDIVGECFVLERCLGAFAIDASTDFARTQMQALLNALVAFAPWQTIDFVHRCSEDFAGHAGLELYTTLSIPEGDQANVGHLMDYFVHFGKIAANFADVGRIDLAEKCWSSMLDVSLRLCSERDAHFNDLIGQYLASAHYNRGLVRLQQDRNQEAREDLDRAAQLADMKIASTSGGMSRFEAQRTQFSAVRLLAVADLKLGDLSESLRNLDRILQDREATMLETVEALLLRSEVSRRQGDFDGSIADLHAVLAVDHREMVDQKHEAAASLPKSLLGRSIRHAEAGELELALNDVNEALEYVARDTELWPIVLVNRSALHLRRGRWDLAQVDCTAVIEAPHAPYGEKAKALLNRALTHREGGDVANAIVDINRAVELATPSSREQSSALLLKAQINWKKMAATEARADLDRVLGNATLDDDLRLAAMNMLQQIEAHGTR
jgi:tetratricopeptide (TPR) repeat protein